MSKAIEVFISGVTGVFFGMALLYVSIKIMGKVSDKMETVQKEKKNA